MVAGPAPVLGVIPVTVTGVVMVGVEPEGEATTTGVVVGLLRKKEIIVGKNKTIKTIKLLLRYLISCRTATIDELFNLTGVLFKTVTGTGTGAGIEGGI